MKKNSFVVVVVDNDEQEVNGKEGRTYWLLLAIRGQPWCNNDVSRALYRA
jgi:hypothetical protein